MLSVGTYLLVFAAVAAPVGRAHRSGDLPSSTNDEAACDSGDSRECAVAPPANLLSPTDDNRSCDYGDSHQCLLEPLSEEVAPLMYDDASCLSGDSWECAVQPPFEELPAPTVILSCESSYVVKMIGSCDLPEPEPPLGSSRPPTLRSGAATGIAIWSTSDHGGSVIIVSPPPSVDVAALSAVQPSTVRPPASPLFESPSIPARAPSPPRLYRPPRV